MKVSVTILPSTLMVDGKLTEEFMRKVIQVAWLDHLTSPPPANAFAKAASCRYPYASGEGVDEGEREREKRREEKRREEKRRKE